jgi:hypothetical protein
MTWRWGIDSSSESESEQESGPQIPEITSERHLVPRRECSLLDDDDQLK